MTDRRHQPTATNSQTVTVLKAALGLASTARLKPASFRGLDSLLAYRSRTQDSDTPLPVSSKLIQDAATWSVIESTVEAVTASLATAEEPFVVLKGAALAALYPEPHLRPTSDFDILVAPEQLPRVRKALGSDGWQPAVSGRFSEAYLQEEGSCWQAYRPGLAVVEVHFRLWGSVPESFTERILNMAISDETGTLLPAPVHSLIIASAHRWRQERPRRATDLVDACLLLQHHGAAAFNEIVEETRAAGQQLPVCLTLTEASQALPEPWIKHLLKDLHQGLRRSELNLLQQFQRSGDGDTKSWSQVRLAMLLARRPSRAGWRSVLRRVWPHPGVVEQRTPQHHPWPVRRFLALAQSFGRRPPNR